MVIVIVIKINNWKLSNQIYQEIFFNKTIINTYQIKNTQFNSTATTISMTHNLIPQPSQIEKKKKELVSYK